MRHSIACIAFLLSIVSATLSAQEPLSNESVLRLVKAGIGEDTIVGMVNQQPGKYALSGDDMIALKNAGVTDKVIAAMIVRNGTPNTIGQGSTEANRACAELLNKAIDSFGPREQLSAIHSVGWKGTIVQTASNGTTVSSRMERITVYPDRTYMAAQASNGVASRMVITPEVSYFSSGSMTSAVPASTLADNRDAPRFDPFYIALHFSDYSCTSEGTEQIGVFRAPSSGSAGRAARCIGASIPPMGGY